MPALRPVCFSPERLIVSLRLEVRAYLRESLLDPAQEPAQEPDPQGAEQWSVRIDLVSDRRAGHDRENRPGTSGSAL